jgi:hypothetical protein
MQPIMLPKDLQKIDEDLPRPQYLMLCPLHWVLTDLEGSDKEVMSTEGSD